ncbi:MAG TPA: hypothetical protein VLN26_18575 [Gaiellaceae bacterium]|nr:hypothetical protein [Gaiellaceae bacterium]
MTDTALFIGWGMTIPGREHHARKLFDETLEIFESLKQAGEIESFEPVLLGPHGGELEGFILVRGEPAKLVALQMREDMERLRIKAQTHHAKFSVIFATIGEGVNRTLTLYDELVKELEREPAIV